MKTRGTLKAILRDDVVSGLLSTHRYISVASVKSALRKKELHYSPNTLKQYLASLKSGGFLHDAGKGWYTFVKAPFEIDPVPTANLVRFLEKKYPLLNFACWSTEQVKSYGHHTLTRFLSFVHVARHNMTAVFESLRDAGWNAYLDPSRTDAGKTFAIREKTVVVRPSISKQPVDGKLAVIEKLLVDLYVECGQLPLMDVAEYRRMFTNLVRSRRIMVATLASYAERRKLQVHDLFEKEEHTISTF